eukprot:maker-scaffold_5-snap-gene-8.5-mRNA-1 protein AED:0.26 eAED:0.26 QI:258/1/1/1/1/1/2/15/307
MKFKATLNRNNVKLLLNGAYCLSKLAEECAITINKETFDMSLKQDVFSRTHSVFRLSISKFNSSLVTSKANDEIYFSIAIKPLIHALKTSIDSHSVVLRLVKFDNLPCFSVTAEMPNSSLNVKQNIPITELLSAAAKVDYSELELPLSNLPKKRKIALVTVNKENCEMSSSDTNGQKKLHEQYITVKLLEPKKIKQILDKMLVMNNTVEIKLSRRGRMELRCYNDIECIKTSFQEVEVSGCSLKANDLTVETGIKKLLAAFQCSIFFNVQADFQSFEMTLLRNKVLSIVATLENDQGLLKYFVPVKS